MSSGVTGGASGSGPPDCARVRGIMIDDALGQASPQLVERARAHLAGCDDCRREVEALRSTVQLLQRRVEPRTSREFRPRLTAALDEVDRQRAPLRVLRPAWSSRRRVAAAAAILPFAIGMGWLLVHEMRRCDDDPGGTIPTRIRDDRGVTRAPVDDPRVHPRPNDQPADATDPDWQRKLVDDLDQQARRRELAHLPPDAPRKPAQNAPLDNGLPDLPDPPAQGPTPKVVKAVPTPIDRALDWLARNQKADGSWTPGRGEAGTETGVTALALLALVSHDHLGAGDSTLDVAARRAQEWLFAQQDPTDGTFRGGRDDAAATFCHAVACLALVEQHVRARAAGLLVPSQEKSDFDRLESALTHLEVQLQILNSSGEQSRCAGNNAAWAALALTTAEHGGVDFHLHARTDALVEQTLARLQANQPELMAAASQTVLTMAERDPKPIPPEDLAWARVVQQVLAQPEKVEPSLRFMIASALYGGPLPRGSGVASWKDFEGLLAKRLLATQSEYGFFDSHMVWECFGGGIVTDTSLAVLTLSVRDRHDAWAQARARLEPVPPKPAPPAGKRPPK
jgi:hypothetical protein